MVGNTIQSIFVIYKCTFESLVNLFKFQMLFKKELSKNDNPSYLANSMPLMQTRNILKKEINICRIVWHKDA